MPMEAGDDMGSLLDLESTLANMTAALEYACRKLPPDRDNPAIRKFIAGEIVKTVEKGQFSLGDLTAVGLSIAK